MDDRQLLRQFVDHNSQEAFGALTERYLSLVYSVCRRELADDETAEDVTQAVFLILARKASTLRRGVVLSGWLFQTARFAAKNARLQAQRRASYEQKAAVQMDQQSGREAAAWAEIEPVLNQSLAALGDGERECVLLRFFQGQSFVEAGAALGLSEEAARKKVTRALEKMRRFFVKEGIIVPAVALAALLSAHAAKAVPTTFHLSLTGSHVSQLSEGVLHAMKVAQLKTTAAIGLAAMVVIGLTTYTVARGITPHAMNSSKPSARVLATLPALAKPGHVLIQKPGKVLTAVQIAAKCRQAYGALRSYQVTTTVTSQGNTSDFPKPLETHALANIMFVRPGKIRAEGTDTSGFSFAYVSDSAATHEKVINRGWEKVPSSEAAIETVTGIAAFAGTTIPSMLLDIAWGNPLAKEIKSDSEVREEQIGGQACYIVTTHVATATRNETRSLWIDEKTFLLRRSVSDSSGLVQIPTILGHSAHSVTANSHYDQRFTEERLNGAIPDSVFVVPETQ